MTGHISSLLILGAGASRGARTPSPPDGGQLLHVLSQVLERLATESEDSPLNLYASAAQWGGQANFFSKREIEQTSQFITRALATQKSYEVAISEVLDESAEGGKDLLLLLNRLIAFNFWYHADGLGPQIAGFRTQADLYDHCIEKLRIDSSWGAVTLNYDILFEQALTRKAVPFFNQGIGAGLVGDMAGMPVFKIHGSINWFPCQAQTIRIENPTPEQKRKATVSMTWDETNRRFSVDFPEVSVSSGELIYQELLRDDPLLRSPVMALYGPRKPVEVNFPTIEKIRSAALKNASGVEKAFIIGVRPVKPEDDHVLHRIFESLRGKKVVYVNPSPEDCHVIAKEFGFETVQKKLSDWLSS